MKIFKLNGVFSSVFIIIDPEECLKEEKCLSMSYIAGNYLGILKID